MLTLVEVHKIARLARIKLSEEEEAKFSSQLSAVLDYVKILEEVNTENITPMAQVTGLQNIVREDLPREKPLAQPDELLSCSQLPKQEHQIKVRKVMG